MNAPPPLPDSEFATRRDKAAHAFAAMPLDAVVIFGTRNWYRDHAVRYLAGYDSPRDPSILFMPLDGREPTLLIGDPDDLDRARRVARVTDVRAEPDLAPAVAALVGAMAGGVRRLGVAGAEGMGFTALDVLPRDIEAAIRKAIPSVELVDAGSALLNLRMIRSPAEIELARAAAAIADVGAAAFLATAREGVTERDVFSEVWKAMQYAGAEDLHISMCRGPGSFWPHPASDAQLSAGDIVSIEISPRIQGYFSQSNRMCFIGGEQREFRELGTMARDALDLALATVRPGIEARVVVAAVSEMIKRSPLATMDVGGVHRTGHGCGLALDEGPFLASNSASILQPNMTLALHPMIYLPYRHSMLMLGDYVRVTETGGEALSTPQAEIPIV